MREGLASLLVFLAFLLRARGTSLFPAGDFETRSLVAERLDSLLFREALGGPCHDGKLGALFFAGFDLDRLDSIQAFERRTDARFTAVSGYAGHDATVGDRSRIFVLALLRAEDRSSKTEHHRADDGE